MMGAGIAYVSANAGIEVVLLDRDISTAEKGKAYSSKVLGKLLEKGVTNQDKADALLARITPTDDFAQLEGCDLIVERSEEHTSELQSLMRSSYDVFCLKKKKSIQRHLTTS